MRSTFLDLKQADHVKALNALIPQADVFMESFSGRGVERLGFAVEEVAKKKPGIVYLSVRCYSWDGPWMNRAGFDMEALKVAGVTMIEGGGDPHSPPGVPVWEGDSDTVTPAFPWREPLLVVRGSDQPVWLIDEEGSPPMRAESLHSSFFFLSDFHLHWLNRQQVPGSNREQASGNLTPRRRNIRQTSWTARFPL
jgi:CoA-transferase family III